MSDAIDRDAAVRAADEAGSGACACGSPSCRALVRRSDVLDAIRALPSASAPAERLARAADFAEPAKATRLDAIVSDLARQGLAQFAEPAKPEPCRNPDCADGYVPSQPDGEPKPCPACRPGGGA